MTQPNFQTVRLTRGRHHSPRDGACVMELASMIAGEPFTDHPRSVCPVLATILRGYNDGIDNRRRQDLYAYAAAVVGTSAPESRAARLRRCEEFFGERVGRRRLLTHSRMEAVGRGAVAYARTANDEAHASFLRLLDELIGTESTTAPLAPPQLTPTSAYALTGR